MVQMFEGREIKKEEGGGQEGQDYADNNWVPQNRRQAKNGVGGLKDVDRSDGWIIR